MRRILMSLMAIFAAAPIAFAQESQPDTEGGRYILRRVDDGLMRVDRESGATSFCRKRDATWVCESVADDREALEDEIARLSRDNSELAIEIGRLKERIAQLEAASSGTPAEPDGTEPDAGDPPQAYRSLPEFDFPTDEEMDKVMQTFESMMRRFLDMMRDLREDYEQDRT